MHRPAVSTAMLLAALCFGLLVAAGAAPGATARANDGERLHVLFVGNSFTQFHNLPRMVRRLLEADGIGPPARVVRETVPGATLRRLYNQRRIRWRISAGGYTHVVIQGHSLRPVTRPDELSAYARRFDALIDQAGAKTILYATWARTGHLDGVPEEFATTPALQRRIDAVYGGLGEDLDADVAPVGRAFSRAAEVAPSIPLLGEDGIHPTPAGTYLAACVFYRVLTGRAASGLSYRPWPMTTNVAATLQSVADRE